jgi:quercetin dioxygenase-like cupin family protein
MKKNKTWSLLLIANAFLIISCSSYQSEIAKEQETATIFPKGEIITSENFTGTAWLEMFLSNDTIYHASMGNVTFEPGARTNWHIHPGGQILLVTDGKGYYQQKGQPAKIISTGDVVKIPPYAEHWHGASPSSGLTHVAISLNLQKGGVVWLGPVTQEEYSDLD